MDKFLSAIGNKIADTLFPPVAQLIEKQFEEWLPKIVKAVVVAVAESAGQLVVNQVDRVTDIIPGKLDDEIVDGIANNALEFLKQILPR